LSSGPSIVPKFVQLSLMFLKTLTCPSFGHPATASAELPAAIIDPSSEIATDFPKSLAPVPTPCMLLPIFSQESSTFLQTCTFPVEPPLAPMTTVFPSEERSTE